MNIPNEGNHLVEGYQGKPYTPLMDCPVCRENECGIYQDMCEECETKKESNESTEGE